MAKQRYNYSGNDLSYAKSEVPYVAPPTKELLQLLDNRENSYIKTQGNINIAKELENNLPYNPASKGIYDELVTNVDNHLSKITPDNYADSELDTAQLAVDINNTMGGTQLKNQQADYLAKKQAIDTAEGVRPEKKAMYTDILANSVQPITRDKNGKLITPALATPKVVKDVDLFEKVNKVLTDWQSQGKYIYDPTTGKINIDKDVVGQFGITKATYNDKTELYSAALSYLKNDSVNAEYLDSEADFQLYGKKPTDESVFKSVPKDILASYVYDKPAGEITKEDITNVTLDKLKNFTKSNPDLLKDIAKHGAKAQVMQEVGNTLANKWGKYDETKTLYDDKEFAEMVKAKYAPPKVSADAPNNAPLVFVQDASTSTVGSPVIFQKYEEEESQNIKTYIDAKKNFDAYTIQAKNALPSEQARLKENINAAKEELEKADARIQQSRQAQTNLVESTVQMAKSPSKGVNIEKAYQDNASTMVNLLVNSNKTQAKETGYALDITDKLGNKGKNPSTGQDYVKLKVKGLENEEIPVYTKEYATANKDNLTTTYAVKNNGNNGYSLYQPPRAVSDNDNVGRISDQVLDAVGVDKLVDNPYKSKRAVLEEQRTGYQPLKTLDKYPQLDDFKSAVTKLFMNPDATVTEIAPIFVPLAKEQADKLRKVATPADVKVNQTLNYLYIDKDVKKGTAASRLLDLTQAVDRTIESNGNQYKVVNDNGQWEDLPAYLKSKGIPYTREFIDFDNLKSSVMLTADRQYGQKLNLPIRLTEKGRAALLNADDKAFDTAGTLNLTAVNYTGKNSSFNKNLVDGVYNAYKESYKNTLPSGEDERKAYGLIAFNNSQYSEDFYNLNLYTLADGASATYKVPTGESIVINAIKRSANPTRLGDNDFFLTNPNGDVFAYNKQTGKSGFVPKSSYDADIESRTYKRQLFASPEDIGAIIGKNFLSTQAIKANEVKVQNNQARTTGSTYTVKPDSIISNTHTTSVNNTTKEYGKIATPRTILDYDGKEVTVASRINPSQMTNVKDLLPNQIKAGTYPYLNNSIVNKAVPLIKDYDLHVTELYRPEGRNEKLKGSAANSLHLYGKSLDATYSASADKLLKELEASPEMASNLGISYAFKHVIDGTPHLHIDFN